MSDRVFRPVATILAVTFGLFLGLPVLALFARALLGGSIGEVLASPAVIDALRLSLVTTAVSLGIAVMFGTPVALLLARRRFRGHALLETLVDLPIVLPPSVAGLALLFVFGRRGLLGGGLEILGIAIPFTTVAVILAQVFVAAPFYVRAARSGFAAVDRDLEDAARVDGAADAAVLWRVTVPLAASSLAAGLVLTWARALGEFGATIMFAGNIAGRTQTLPLLVYSEFQLDLETSIAAATVLIVAAAAVLLAVRLLHWRSVLDVRLPGS
jgi:molybdate transport system permease protein